MAESEVECFSGIKTAQNSKMADRTWHEGKLNAPKNHIIDVAIVANYWACGCQRPLTSGT